jgi:multimeric flavodoxin WrbA
MAILGFSSSPIIGGNVDRMVHVILEKCGEATEFFNLTELSFGPCRACVHLCAGDNLCKLDDDLKHLYPKIISSDAIVLGTPIYHSNMNGFMTVFLERLWGFRHQRFPLEGKPYAVVASGAGIGTPVTAIEAVKLRMSAYRADYIGSVWFNSRIFPCLKCGYGLTCKVGRLYEFYGEEGQKKLKITKQLFGQWEDSIEVTSKLDALAQQIKSYLHEA